jgi:hypothetical protein
MIIGSTAMKHHFPDFREPRDLDAFAHGKVGSGYEPFWDDSFPEEWLHDGFATIDQLYTIKISHSFWELHGTWEKHMYDMMVLNKAGAKFDREMYDILYPVWKSLHGKNRVNLNQGKNAFFADAVIRKYDHDSLHMSCCYNDRPMYEQILRDGSEVLTDRAKFDSLSYEDQLKVIREETYATALERWVIPSDYRVSPRGAYAKAMKKCITSLFKGEMALWIVLNYENLVQPDIDYVALHKSKAHHLITL